MIFKRMTAVFGKLDRETLELQEGLNIITAPNEAGKSTWASFLLAMLYGVDTTERATKSNLPVKTKYKPWSGHAMEGSLELQWQGRSLTLERASQGRTPMGQLLAYDTATGQPAGLQTETCGQTLLGVERSVYERSGFIRQLGMALSGDHALEARLNALVTTGDETVSYSQVERRLRDLRNRRRHNKTGLLPQAEAELVQVEEQLSGLSQLGREILELTARRDSLEAQEQTLARIDAALKARDAAQKRQKLETARLNWEKKARFLAEKEETVQGLPQLEPLQTLLRELDRLAEDEKALEADLRMGIASPEPPDCPPVFAGLDAEAVRQKAEADAAALAQLQSRQQYHPAMVWMLLCLAVLGLACGIASAAELLPPFAGGGWALAVVSAALTWLRRRKNRSAQAARQELLARYGAEDALGIHRAANNYREAVLLYEERLAAAASQRQALDRRQAGLSAREAQLLSKVAGFAPGCAGLPEARAAVQQAVYRQQFYIASRRESEQAQAQYEAVAAAVGSLPEELPSPEPLAEDYDPDEVTLRLSRVRQALREARSQLDLHRGRMEAAGDPAALAARKEQLADRIALLQQEYDALTLAMDALASANETLQTRFSPQINELAGQYMARMTHGRYDRVLLGQDLSVTAREAGTSLTRPLLAMSAGTADQLYLAVRLAICQLALPEDIPLVLDDALITFDDDRMAQAIELLLDLASRRQILLFTCQSREQAWLDATQKEQTSI